MFIREMAARTGLSSDTLRYYERIGLMPPVPRKRGGIRIYNEVHVRYVKIILSLKASGMSLEEIQEYMELAKEGKKTEEKRKSLIVAAKRKLQAKIVAMQQAVWEADFQIAYYDTALGMQTASIAPMLAQ